MRTLLLLLLGCFSIHAGVRFDGSDDFCHRDGAQGFDWTNEITISLWFLRETGGSGTYMEIISKAIVVSGDRAHFGTRMNRLTDKFDFYFTHAPGNYEVCGYGVIPESDWKWHHAAFRMVWKQPATAQCFIDGVSETIGGTEGNIDNWTMTTIDPVRMGFTYSGSAFKGQIDEIAIWNVRLSDFEMQSLYTSRIKGFPMQLKPQNLVAYWPFDQVPSYTAATGTNTFRDLGSGNLHLTPVNSPVARPNELFSYP